MSRAEEAHRLAWPERCDAVALRRLRDRCRSGAAGADLAVLDALAKRKAAAALARQVAAIAAERARLGLDAPGSGVGVLDRASRYLAAFDGSSSSSAFRAAVALVRGFALDEGAALELLSREYAPRFHRALPRRELVALVQRASRARRTGYGWLLGGRAA